MARRSLAEPGVGTIYGDVREPSGAGKEGGLLDGPRRWTEECLNELNDVETAEELGAKWEGDELVTYDLPGLKELLEYYTDDEYLPDND